MKQELKKNATAKIRSGRSCRTTHRQTHNWKQLLVITDSKFACTDYMQITGSAQHGTAETQCMIVVYSCKFNVIYV